MCDVFLSFITFSLDVLGQVWYLIVLIPDLCLLPYFGRGHYKEHKVYFGQWELQSFQYACPEVPPAHVGVIISSIR